jgi:hypothetical protein
VDPIDVDNNGNTVTSFPTITAAPFTGIRSAPGLGGYAFNGKNYQTGSWYDFQTTIHWSDGSSEVADYSTHPELTWRFLNLNSQWSFDANYYPVTTTTNMPYSGLDTRLLWKNNWQPIRFDLFSEDNIPKPSGQENYNFGQTYIIANSWAHEPTDLVITGPTVVSDPTATQSYQSWLNWGDAARMNQSGVVSGSNTNPWGNLNRTEVTNQLWTKWFKDTITEPTPISGPFQTSFPEFKANNHYRTIASSWGDQHRTLPGFQYWDYYYSQISVYFNANPGPNCDNQVPSMGCKLPIDNGGTNFRMPKTSDINVNHSVESSLKFMVTGTSTGSGE